MLKSRERVRRALNGEEIDRIPFDLGATSFSSYHLNVAQEVNDLLNINQADFDYTSFRAQTVIPHNLVLDKLQIDTFGIASGTPIKDKFIFDSEEDSYIDEWGIKYRKAPNSYQYDYIFHPLKDAVLGDLGGFEWPDPLDQGRFISMAETAKRLYETTDYSLVLNTPVSSQIIGHMAGLIGFERVFTGLIEEKDFIVALANYVLDWHLAWLDKALAEVGEYVDVVAIADDLGIQNGPMINPATYRQLIKPLHQKMFAFIKERSSAKLLFHSCGSVNAFIPDLIDMGMDILNPVQYKAANMDLAMLKEKYGKQISFWGAACDAQKILPFDDVEKVRSEAGKNVQVLKPGGCFVFAPIHNIVPGVSGEKVVAMYEAALENGRY